MPKKTKKFEFEKNCLAILFAIKNNPYTQILSIVGVSVGDLRRKQIIKLETGKKSTVLKIFVCRDPKGICGKITLAPSKIESGTDLN